MLNTLEALEGRRLMAAGTIDTSFGESGIAYIRAVDASDSGIPGTRPVAIRVDSGGRALVLSRSQKTMNLTRLTADGTPDGRFATATNGTLVIDATSETADGTPSTYRLQIDGFNRIYLLIDNTLYRFTSSGRRDNTYGNHGRVKLGTDGQRFAAKDMTQFNANGDMLVVGGVDDAVGERRVRSVGVFQIDPNGVASYVRTAPQVLANPVADYRGLFTPFIRQTPDGKVVVAAEHRSIDTSPATYVFTQGIESFRLDTDLSLDKTYGKRGRAFLLDTANKITPVGIRGDGAVVGARDRVADGVDNVVITSQGRYEGGVTNFGEALINAQFVRQSDGREIVLNSRTMTLRRLSADNSIDSSFNGGRPLKGAQTATVAADGSILFVTTGSVDNDNRLDVIRVYANEGPAARLVPTTLVSPSRELPFRVIFRDDDGVDVDSITSQVLRVIAPDGTATRPVLTGVSEANGNVIADFVYRPADRKLNAQDNGVFTVRLLAGRALDINGNVAEARTLGSIVVRIA